MSKAYFKKLKPDFEKRVYVAKNPCHRTDQELASLAIIIMMTFLLIVVKHIYIPKFSFKVCVASSLFTF